jgi:hypothetical protein
MTPARALRWALHPRATAVLVLAVVVAGTAAAVRGAAGAGVLLACAAGCAAGFANSGST